MSNEVLPSTPTADSSPAQRQTWRRPRYEVKPGKESYELSVYLPGVSREQAEVTIEKDQLLVVGRRSFPKPEGAKVVHEELSADDYRLQLQLNINIDTDHIAAQSENGILKVTLPIAEESKPRAIEIE